MKKYYCITFLIITFLFAVVSQTFAQDEPRVRNANDDDESAFEEKGFKKENLFTGGNFTLSFGSGYSVLGVSPMLGYKLNDYFDAGAVINYVFTGTRDYYTFNDKLRQHTYGPGVFVRGYPVPMFFLQAQPEYNFITQTYAMGSQRTSATASAPSLLLGGGYAGGRTKGGNTFYYMSILVDVLKNANSPYVNIAIDPNTGARSVRMSPVIRAGFNIGLFQKRYRQYYE